MTIEIFGTRSIIQHMITSFIGDGYVLVRSWSKKKYFWFGKETFYAELEMEEAKPKLKLLFDGKEIGECTEIELDVSSIDIGVLPIGHSFVFGGVMPDLDADEVASEYGHEIKFGIPTTQLSPKKLKAELDHALSMEDYEYASEIRDKIKELDAKN